MSEITFADCIELAVLFMGYIAFFFLGKMRSDWKHADEMIRLKQYIFNLEIRAARPIKANPEWKENIDFGRSAANHVIHPETQSSKCCECGKEGNWKLIYPETKKENCYCSDHFPKIS